MGVKRISGVHPILVFLLPRSSRTSEFVDQRSGSVPLSCACRALSNLWGIPRAYLEGFPADKRSIVV